MKLDQLNPAERKMVDDAYDAAHRSLQCAGELIHWVDDEYAIKEAIASFVIKGRNPDGSRTIDAARLWR